MLILFSSLGTYGHTYPLLPLARAARQQGHEVLYATTEELHPTLRALDLTPVTAGMPLEEAFALASGGAQFPPVGPPPTQGESLELAAKAFTEVLPRRLAADLAPVLADRRPDLVVHELGAPGAGLAARVAGVPALCHGFGRVGPALTWEAVTGQFADVAAELGVALPSEHAFLVGHPYLDICPPSWQDKAFTPASGRLPLRPVAFAEPGELPAGVAEHDRPLVYLTLGTAFGHADVLRGALAALSALDVRVLVAAGPTVQVEALGEVPENVLVRQWVPQARVLPHADLVVHHGGSGTTLGALAAGVPQLVLPQGADQFDNGAALAEAGLGEQLLGQEVTAEAITERARALLADEVVRAAARAVAAEIATMPSPEEVAARLHEYAR
ncbi:UDP:flavonoid glycosyltransferase YjiC (YdhE family) [Saccharothrix coeruleofusca]|uniref:glycosyltransferase n=1 Tax=Saccharothrix coeruleofusca TaxID=33919 RepID=UPI001AE48A6F|nr:glycosyltransferase [Saccharothrix coeruleofusca]MBP2337595.1 UDP:flavonoid glycosyltransferase YjiC (YdhE family) [Saccharothrix coeruleofusca]